MIGVSRFHCTKEFTADNFPFSVSVLQIIGNEEISNVVKILGLQYSKKYVDPADLRTLRYGKLMIMTDQDQDGSHIKGLVINFIHHNWPHLLRHSFLEEFITPIVKVCILVCVCMCVCACACGCVYVLVLACVCGCARMCVCVLVLVLVLVLVSVCVCARVCVHMCVCTLYMT